MKKFIIISLVTVVAILALGIGVLFWFSPANPYYLRLWSRKNWRDHAVSEIAHRTADPAWSQKELATLKTLTTESRPPSDSWISPTLVAMTNGEWIAYANICHKENFKIHDLFIGRASDGKWYFSTYHFCVCMVVLRMRGDMEGQPGSIREFAAKYYLKEFDGHSDECLKKTWPPEQR